MMLWMLPAQAQMRFNELYSADGSIVMSWNARAGEYETVDHMRTHRRLNIRITREQIRIDDPVERQKFVFDLRDLDVDEDEDGTTRYTFYPDTRHHFFQVVWMNDEDDPSESGYRLFWYYNYDEQLERHRNVQVTGVMYRPRQ